MTDTEKPAAVNGRAGRREPERMVCAADLEHALVDLFDAEELVRCAAENRDEAAFTAAANVLCDARRRLTEEVLGPEYRRSGKIVAEPAGERAAAPAVGERLVAPPGGMPLALSYRIAEVGTVASHLREALCTLTMVASCASPDLALLREEVDTARVRMARWEDAIDDAARAVLAAAARPDGERAEARPAAT